MSDPVHHILLSNVRFAYRGQATPVLDIEALNVHAGEKVALIGASGAGKTTLLKLIDGRLIGWSGKADVLGRALSPRRRLQRAARADVGFVFQDFALIDRLTVFENVRNGRLGRMRPVLSLGGRLTAHDTEAVERAIADVGLDDLISQRVDRLSGGQRQRVGVARCLAQEPRILIADEPVSNLDPGGAEKILKLLRETAEARDATLLISSHQPKMVAGFVDRLVGLKHGRIAFDRLAGSMTSDDLAALYGLQVAATPAA